MGPSDAEPTDLIRSVSRALRVLEQVTQAERPLTVKVIARRCGLNLSTTYHLVRTLAAWGEQGARALQTSGREKAAVAPPLTARGT